MNNHLAPILLQKHQEVAALYQLIKNQPEHLIAKILRREVIRHPKVYYSDNSQQIAFKKALTSDRLAVIAEIKRKSPSRGELASIKDPIHLAKKYVAGGANVLSVLTDEKFFGGTLEDLADIAEVLGDHCPILRKDFIIDEIQIAEAVAAGADAVLLIVAALGDRIKLLLDTAKAFNIDVLVEVHDHAELKLALVSGAEIIGVNNRDLNTFVVDPNRSLQLVQEIPANIIKVAESGILQAELAQEYFRAGFNAVLIGEALVKSPHPEQFIEACRYG